MNKSTDRYYDDPKLIEAYGYGIDAAYRMATYGNYKDILDNPYQDDTLEADAWWDGFNDGIEDFIKKISLMRNILNKK